MLHISYMWNLKFWAWSCGREEVNKLETEFQRGENWGVVLVDNSSQAEGRNALCHWMAWASNKQWLFRKERFSWFMSAHAEKGGQLLRGSVATCAIATSKCEEGNLHRYVKPQSSCSRITAFSLVGVTQWIDWVPAWESKGHWINSQSGHMFGLRARSSVGGTQEAPIHWCCFPSLSPSLPLSVNNK